MAEDHSKNILVTGGAGYVGSHACEVLSRFGFTPITFDNLSRGFRSAVKWGPLEQGDILSASDLDQVFKKYQPIAVMHFAALAYVGESVKDPALYYRNNVTGSLQLFEKAIQYNVKNLIFSSTCATYGEPQGDRLLTEGHPQNPVNPYGRSKLMIEKILKDFYSAYGLNSVSLRYFNAAGASLEGEIGERHDPETHLIPLAIEAALESKRQLEIYGEDYPTPDGTCVRDYVHVSDLAQAHVLSLQSLLQGEGGVRAYNLSNGNGFSVKEVISMVEKVSQKKVPHQAVGRRPGDPPKLVGDSNKIRDELGWSPEFADLKTIIETALKWHQKKA